MKLVEKIRRPFMRGDAIVVFALVNLQVIVMSADSTEARATMST